MKTIINSPDVICYSLSASGKRDQNYNLFKFIKGFFSRIFFLPFVSIFVLALVAGGDAWGQVITKYTFSNNTSSSLTDLSSGATDLLSGNNDDAATVVTTIGFDFFYGGVRYTHFSANSNGQFQLHTTSGATAIGSTAITAYAASTPRLFPMSGDNEVNGGIRYKVIGAAPNRTLVIEWVNFYAFYTNITNAGNMQAWLEESTGKISYVYGEIYNSSAATAPRGIALSFGSTATTAGYVTVGASPTFTASATLTTNTFAIGSGNTTGSPLIANLGTSSASARRAYVFTPPSSMASPTSLTFTSVTTSDMTLNWTASSPTTNVLKYVIYNSTDNVNFTYHGIVNVGTNTYTATGLTISTLYYWKVYPVSEGALGTALSSSQSTASPTTYYWTGTATAEFNTAATWNTAADNSGSARSSALSTDILIIDGAGTTAGTAITGGTITTSATVSQLKITSNTAVTLASNNTTQKVITISGNSAGDDFVIGSGSTLNLTNTANTISIIFSGTGTTGDISGTLNVAGTTTVATTSNSFLTTGGTSTVVTVSSTGIINNTATSNIATNGNVTGSAATLVFANGSSYNVSGATTAAPWIPLATWGATSNLTISGLTSSATTATNNVQSFGNFIYNCPAAAATMNFWATSTTAEIKGNLTITATNTGTFRALSSGTLTVNGNLNINGGKFETFGGAGIFNVLGNINLAGGNLDVAAGAGATNLKGNFTQTGGTLTQTTNTGKLSFNGTVAQTFTPTTHTSTALVVEINNSLGVTLSGALNLFKLTLTSGNITTGANVITIINTATTGISGGSASSFVYGKLARTLPAGVSGAANVYTFPVGKGSYNPFEIVNPITGATTPVVRAEVFDADCGGTAGTNMCSLYSTRYWAASVTSGNFTSSFIKLTDAGVVSSSAIASSGTLTGAYAVVGSTTPTIVVSTSVQSTTTATSIPGFFVIGTVSRTPTITAGTLTSFGTSNCINVVAGPNSFTVTGASLTGNLTVGALTGFTYAATAGGTYTSTLALTAGTCGAISTTVYVKFSPTAAQSYNGNISLTGGGATTVNVAATATAIGISNVTSPAASTVSASTVLTWTNPASCFDEIMIVVAPATNTGTPSGDGTAYTSNLVYGSGTLLGNGYVVYEGTSSSQTITSLTNETTYSIKFFTRKGTTWSSGVEITVTPSLPYCVPTVSTLPDGITKVEFNTISNVTTGANAYTNYTATQSTNVNRGNAYTINVYVKTGNAGNAYTNYQKVWIDWNQDGVFNTTAGSSSGLGEEYALGTAYGTVNAISSLCPFTITVPSNATLGVTRMRVSSTYNAYKAPCGVSIDGEYEDYKIIITNTDCSSITTFFSKSTGNLDVLTNWGASTDGTGCNPSNFTTAGITYVIQNNAAATTSSSGWSVSGAGSIVKVGDASSAITFLAGGDLSFDCDLQITANATLNLNNKNMTLSGDFVRSAASAVFNAGGTSSIVTFSGAAQNVNVTAVDGTIPTDSDLTFNHVTISGSNVKMFYFKTNDRKLNINNFTVNTGKVVTLYSNPQ